MRLPAVAARVPLLAGLLIASAAHAKKVEPPPAAPVAPPRDFWQEAIDPDGAEIAQILTVVQTQAIAPMDTLEDTDLLTPSQHARLLADALHRLEYARRRAPQNVRVLALLGRIADELGRTSEAIDALQAALDLVGPEKAGVDVTGLLGSIELRRGHVDRAIQLLRLAQRSATMSSGGTALVDLANALAMRGQPDDAIDVLAAALPRAGEWAPDRVGVAFALAVLYDRADQPGAAYTVLDRLRSAMSERGLTVVVQLWIAARRFAPAEDEAYYTALLDEVGDAYPEARTEWLTYAASDGAYRARALEHVAAIDAMPTAVADAPPPKLPRVVVP